MKEYNLVTINARKFDDSIYRSWQCKLIEETDEFFVFFGKFESQINHKQLGIIRPDTASYEYYWKNEYYNVFQFYEPDGEFRNFYCNLNLPPIFANNILNYVDMDIDILIWKDFSVEILDMDEYETNIQKYGYPGEIQQKILQSLEDLLKKIKEKAFPFDINI